MYRSQSFNPNMSEHDESDWKKTWEERQRGLEAVLGKADGSVFHSPVPFFLGGNADVLRFPNFVPGMTYVTSELTGDESEQIPSSLGIYELMICGRTDLDRGANLIAQLAGYTCEAILEPGQTMDIENYFGDKTIRALLFANPREGGLSFDCAGQKCGLLLCLGITADELSFAREFGNAKLLAELQRANVFPYTEPDRPTIPI
jgi:hypothetical protein